LWLYVPGVVIVLGGVLIFRWLGALTRKVSDLAERVAHLEGRGNHRTTDT